MALERIEEDCFPHPFSDVKKLHLKVKFFQIHSAELSEVQAEKTICMESIARLKQEAKDQEEMMKVLEKKHVAMVSGFLVKKLIK